MDFKIKNEIVTERAFNQVNLSQKNEHKEPLLGSSDNPLKTLSSNGNPVNINRYDLENSKVEVTVDGRGSTPPLPEEYQIIDLDIDPNSSMLHLYPHPDDYSLFPAFDDKPDLADGKNDQESTRLISKLPKSKAGLFNSKKKKDEFCPLKCPTKCIIL